MGRKGFRPWYLAVGVVGDLKILQNRKTSAIICNTSILESRKTRKTKNARELSALGAPKKSY